MLKIAACAQLKAALMEASAEQFAQVKTLMEKGAGCLGLPEGSYLAEPVDVQQERRCVLAELVDAVYDYEQGDEFSLPRAGAWEYVIATLVIERDWEKIGETAKELEEQAA